MAGWMDGLRVSRAHQMEESFLRRAHASPTPPRKLAHTKPVGRLLGVDGPTSPVVGWCWTTGDSSGEEDALVLQHVTIVQGANSLTRRLI